LIISTTDVPRVSKENAQKRNLYVASQCKKLIIGSLPQTSSLNEIVNWCQNNGVEVEVLGV